MKKILIVGVMIFILLFSGCVSNTQKDQKEKETVKVPDQKIEQNKGDIKDKENKEIKNLAIVKVVFVRVGNLEFIADELGFFKEKGIKIDWIPELPPQQAGGNRFALLASGLFDYTAGPHTDSVIRVRRSGGKIKIVGGFTDSTKEKPHMLYYVLKDSPIKGPKDLIGKKIAGVTGRAENIELVGCIGYGLAEYLASGGIDIKKAQIEGVVLPVTQMEQVLKSKLVDVIQGHPPYTGRFSSVPEFRELFSDYDSISPILGRGATSIAVVREGWLEKNPEVARNFISALVLASAWTNAHQEEAKKIFAKRLEIAPENVQYLTTYSWMPGLVVDEKSNIQFFIDEMVKYGEIKEGEVKATDLYTNDYNPYYSLLKDGKLKNEDILKEAEDVASRNYPDYMKS